MSRRDVVATAVAVAIALASRSALTVSAPVTDRKPVTDDYHGVNVIDDYRWLENWDIPAVKAWSDAQNAYARSVLDELPSVGAIRTRITQLRTAGVVSYRTLTWRGARLFALKTQPPRQQPVLITLADPDNPASARVVFDPTAIDPSGSTSMDWYAPSPDGKLVAISLATGGSERGDVHVYETASGKPLADIIPRVNGGTAGGSLTWAADSSGFYYTRYPREGERAPVDMDFYVQVYFHALGAPTAKDRYEIGKEFPRIAEIFLRTSPNGQFVLANVQNGDSGEFSQSVRTPDGKWIRLTTFSDQVVAAVFGPDQSLYLLSRNGAPRGKVLHLPLDEVRSPRLAGAITIVPESRDASPEFDPFGPDSMVTTASRLYVIDQIGGPNQVRVFTLAGKSLGTLSLPPIPSVTELVPVAGGALLFSAVTYVQPSTWYKLNPSDSRTTRLAISSTSPADFSDSEVVREYATSKDGTRIPINILRRKGTVLNGKNPTLLTGYGGFASSRKPAFQTGLRVWLEQGGLFAEANLRGGSEFGEEWHRAGNLTNKQHVFDDFIASAEHLVKAGYTQPERLAIQGGSNGGLLMGAALTQRPELFKAVVSRVGIYDMLRSELSPNGSFNVPEYGSVKNPGQFRALYAYSPYHHVKDGTTYPAVLMMTGANDPRVDPMHSRKMTARLQAATRSQAPVLLRTSANSGHGIGSALSQIVEQEVDAYAFLFSQLNVPYRMPGTK